MSRTEPMKTPEEPLVAQAAVVTVVADEGNWNDGLFDCCSDCSSLWAAMCCPACVLAQLWTKTQATALPSATRRVICTVLALFFFFFATGYGTGLLNLLGGTEVERAGADPCLAIIPSDEGQRTAHHHRLIRLCDEQMRSAARAANACLFKYLVMLVGLIMLVIVRKTIRKRDSIPADQVCCEDMCCALWCGSCTIMQLMRHERMSGGRYNLFSPTGLNDALPI